MSDLIAVVLATALTVAGATYGLKTISTVESKTRARIEQLDKEAHSGMDKVNAILAEPARVGDATP